VNEAETPLKFAAAITAWPVQQPVEEFDRLRHRMDAMTE
jgi:hypothetical protein